MASTANHSKSNLVLHLVIMFVESPYGSTDIHANLQTNKHTYCMQLQHSFSWVWVIYKWIKATGKDCCEKIKKIIKQTILNQCSSEHILMYQDWD